MEIKRVSYDEFDTLMKVMNTSFNFNDDNKFELLLPKLYYKDNKDMIHIGAYEDGKLVSSIGIYKMKLIHDDKTLNIGCIGAVSTLPEYRKKGYFSKVIQEVLNESKKLSLDLLFLGGDRTRYGRYGFENAGRSFVFQITSRTRPLLEKQEYSIQKVERNNRKMHEDILCLYNKKTEYRIERNVDNIYDVLTSWFARIYAVLVDGKLVSYFALEGENNITEFAYEDGYKDAMFNAMLDVHDNMNIQAPMSMYDNDTLSKISWYRSEHNQMYNIQDFNRVAKFMNVDLDSIKNLDHKEKIRKILGDAINNNISNSSIFIFQSDAG